MRRLPRSKCVMLTRRCLLNTTALGSLLSGEPMASLPHHAAKAKRVIFLFQHGGPSQLDLFDWKPNLAKVRGQELPESVRQGQRLTGMTAYQASFPTAPTIFPFAQRGKSGAWMSDLMPHTAKIADELCIMKSMHTE